MNFSKKYCRKRLFAFDKIKTILLVGSISFASAASLSTNLSPKDFSGKDLTDKNFLGQDLKHANFRGAVLLGAVFSNADLTGANFENSILGKSSKGSTDFTLANLTDADMQNLNIKSTIDFQYADITNTNFTGLDKSKANFGPHLNFNTLSGKKPNFSNTKMDCEFPWHWEHLNLSGASLPKCVNHLKDSVKTEKSSSVGVKKALSNFDVPQPIEMVKAPSAAMAMSVNLQDTTPVTGNKVFVSTSGTDNSSCGTAVGAEACKTIAKGIARCSTIGAPCTVLIDYGKYAVSSTIAIPTNINLTGGCINGVPSSSYQSTLTAPVGGSPIFTTNNITSLVQNLILVGSSTNTVGKASVVLQLTNTSAFTLKNVDVHAATGIDAPISGNGSSTNGGNGKNWDKGNTGGTSSCGSYNAGGLGGDKWDANASCSGNWSTDHSTHCSYNSGRNRGSSGGSGQSTAGAGTWNSGKACTFNGAGTATATGGAGGTGATASVQVSPSSNRIGNFSTAGIWSPQFSPTGNRGLDGGGGGGGGAGQARVDGHFPFLKSCYTNTDNGKGGGGGGAGGCGASGGVGGQMGTGSFGIVLVNSSLVVGEKLKVIGAQGGTGGNAGTGATGGTGGTGGSNCGGSCGGAAQSGAGGKGGAGGASGGGAGGNGGPSVGIVLIGTSTYTLGPTSIYPGASGLPGKGGAGAGSAPAGKDGQSGLAQATYSTTAK